MAADQDDMADAWAAALAESKGAGTGTDVASELAGPAEQVSPAAFTTLSSPV